MLKKSEQVRVALRLTSDTDAGLVVEAPSYTTVEELLDTSSAFHRILLREMVKSLVGYVDARTEK